MTAQAASAAAPALAVPPGLSGPRRNGRVGVLSEDRQQRLTAAEIGAPLGERATLVQFSSAFCAPCRATRHILAHVADLVAGVRHVEIDAESRLDLVRRLSVAKTPTVLVLDSGGVVIRRAVGQPRRADVIAALGAVVS